MVGEIGYWMEELSGRAESTKKKYQFILKQFCEYLAKTPEQIVAERKEDLKSVDIMEKRRYERMLKGFMDYLL